MKSRFSHLERAAPVPVFQLMKDFQEDVDPRKVNLIVGAYRTEEGTPWILPVVKKAENKLVEKIDRDEINLEYTSLRGLASFSSAATSLLLGESNKLIQDGKVFGYQCVSGTGAVRVGVEYLRRFQDHRVFYISDPTWLNHDFICQAGSIDIIRKYRYWNAETKRLDFTGMIQDLESAPRNSVIILHVCGHNPTGIDPSRDEWEAIADTIHSRNHFPFFDCAYQGLASGCPDTDAWPVRMFAARGLEFFCAQSFSKNFGLYNERVGNLTVVLRDAGLVEMVQAQLSGGVTRGMWLMPPAYGARIVEMILGDRDMREEWRESVRVMARRLKQMRKGLRDSLEKLDTLGDWKAITEQVGMFSYSNLTPKMCKFLIQEKHIYLVLNGRISMCGLTSNNIDYVASSICEAIKMFQK